ncbi:helix-turn-helix domain-containing protein [Mucilaginibacter sp. SP1R1]|uniref:helix-turn-helix domain-containing protein n=1 Tax=Mucilaginibacter sp. SP1R1 TaxID=2723091 RepID=UPI001819AEC5|nr:helix-turn-helix transcriptional regulator [Mucilaginibacter sp. SP1R1]MBB6148280.1 transcriptional regulator with XRE-family HTH domain [Mucilaginibacter sp. SP1R1]
MNELQRMEEYYLLYGINMDEYMSRLTLRFVGENIRILRRRHGWSLEDTAGRLDISAAALSKIETGFTDINFSRLSQIAAVYEVEVSALLTEDFRENDHQPLITGSPVQNKAFHQESEILALQSKIISLYEELYQFSAK